MGIRTAGNRRSHRTATPRQRAVAVALVVAAAVLAAAAAAAGWWAGGRMTSDAPPAPQAAAVGPVALQVAPGWRPETSAAVVAESGGGSSAVFATAPGGPVRAVIAFGTASDASLIPDRLLADASPAPGAAAETMLLGIPAWRYRDVPLAGGRVAEVTVVPTTEGVLGIACVAPRREAAEALGCSAGIRSLTLERGGWVAPSARLAAAERTVPVIERLDGERARARQALAAADRRRGQARAARRLASAYGRAAAALQPAAGTQASADLLGALRGTQDAYEALATAAGRGRPRRFAAARRAVGAAEAAVRRAAAGVAAAARP